MPVSSNPGPQNHQSPVFHRGTDLRKEARSQVVLGVPQAWEQLTFSPSPPTASTRGLQQQAHPNWYRYRPQKKNRKVTDLYFDGILLVYLVGGCYTSSLKKCAQNADVSTVS